MKRALGAALMMLGLSVPASAQTLSYSDAATAGCLNRAASTVARRACIGLSASACMSATPGGNTTVGMGGCLDRELTFWDARLNANYRTLRRKAKRADAEMKGTGAIVTDLAPKLRVMQRSWIAYRDASCDFERAQWGGGSGGSPATLSCLLQMTGEQALHLGDVWIGE